MSPRYFLSCLLLGSAISGLSYAQEAKKEQAPLTPAQIAFSNLPEARRIDFAKKIIEANRLFGQKRIFETMEQIYQSRAIFTDSPEAWNLMGSCYVELRNWEKATECFNEAKKLSPNDYAVTFNLAEMDYVQKKWAECIEKLQIVLKALPPKDVATRRIAEFKILLSNIGLGKIDEAKKLADLHDPLDDATPYYYFSQAALKYNEKKIEEAEAFTIRARGIFPNEVLVPWTDTLIEFGYVESFYGGMQNQAEEE